MSSWTESVDIYSQKPDPTIVLWSHSLYKFKNLDQKNPVTPYQKLATQLIKTSIPRVPDVDHLCNLYLRDNRSHLLIARRISPNRLVILNPDLLKAAAFGIRHVEMQTGATIDAKLPLPAWIGEFAISRR
jgi:hypothetical protein